MTAPAAQKKRPFRRAARAERAKQANAVDDLLGLFLADALFDHAEALDERLRFGQAQGGELADGLDDVDLLGADVFEFNVELRLLLFGGSGGTGSGSGGDGHGSGGADAELLFERFDELVELDDGHAFDLFDELSDISHG